MQYDKIKAITTKEFYKIVKISKPGSKPNSPNMLKIIGELNLKTFGEYTFIQNNTKYFVTLWKSIER